MSLPGIVFTTGTVGAYLKTMPELRVTPKSRLHVSQN